MKRLLLFFLSITCLLSLTACSGYNGIMREHLGNEDNYYAIDSLFCSYEEVNDRIYLCVTVVDKSAFDASEANNDELRLEFVGDNCDSLGAYLANEEIRIGDRIAVKCATWIYMDTTFYYVAECIINDKTILSFDNGLNNIIKYMNDHKSLF